MLRSISCCCMLVLVLQAPSLADDPAAAASLPPAVNTAVEYVTHIQPIFQQNCYDCHGPDTQESGLRLDVRKSARQGGDSGPAYEPENSEKSLLVEYVAGVDPDHVMPPDTEGLSDEEVGLIRAWIDQGAEWPDAVSGDELLTQSDHWAFQPIVRPEVPVLDDSGWVHNEIDSFILRHLQEQGVAPSPEADRTTLIRRLSLDLLGLLPKPEEVEAFVADDSPDAYANLVDRLLESTHFGERWGRHWLDKARYADSDGYEKDRPRFDAWRYRDWVINAINDDMPFDQFTTEQLAGDLLEKASEEQLLATAFHRQTLTNTEGGTDQEQWRVEAIFDRVETTGTVWLGLTIGCARCHTHKYDPITQREYYQLFAFFDNGDETTTRVARSEEAVREYDARLAKYEAALHDVKQRLAAAREDLKSSLPDWEQQAQDRLALEAEQPIAFHDLQNVEFSSEQPLEFKTLDDGSTLLQNVKADTATFTVTANAPAGEVTGFRIEVLPHESLPKNGPGLHGNGNFVLSKLGVTRTPGGSEEPSAIELTEPRADIAQDGYPASDVFTDDPQKGWAIKPGVGKPHWLVVKTKSAIGLSVDDRLTFRLDQLYGQMHVIGRLKIQAVTGLHPDPTLPPDIREILAVAPASRTEEQASKLLDHYATLSESTKPLLAELAELEAKAPEPPVMEVRVINERTEERRTTHVMRRGDFLQPLNEVTPGFVQVIDRTEDSADTPQNRLDLAQWLLAPENPLTARVAVNHLWIHLFGDGLVRTANDFGVRGEEPTYMELLDWLATEYRRLGWSRKQMIKTVVMSSTYRQSSAYRPELSEVDPQNHWLARQNRFRVGAEIVRDMSLSAAGLLSTKVGGPSVFPPMPPDVAALSYANNFKWETSAGQDRYRRGMYTFFKRTAPHPNLVAFDCPDSNTTAVTRRISNTPLQALTTLNNVTYVEASRGLAERLMKMEDVADADRLRYGFRLCVSRTPGDEELLELTDLLDESRRWYSEHTDQAGQLVAAGEADAPESADVVEKASWTATARILLNLDEFLTRE